MLYFYTFIKGIAKKMKFLKVIFDSLFSKCILYELFRIIFRDWFSRKRAKS